MTEQELLQRLADDQEITVARAEDILQALNDMVTESLARGERVNLRLGQFELRPIVKEWGDSPHVGARRAVPVPAIVAAVRFRPSVELRARLKLADLKWEIGELCEGCGKRPKKKDPLCSTCKSRAYRARKSSKV